MITTKETSRSLLHPYSEQDGCVLQDFFSVAIDSGELSEETKNKIQKWLDENQ